MLGIVMAVMAVLTAGPPAATDVYAAGQVWEYRTRPQEPDSRLVIRWVEDDPALGRIYHVTLTDLHLRDGRVIDLAHAPVSTQTMDASVTELSGETPELGDWRPAMADWRLHQGRVFTIPVAQIVTIVDGQVSGAAR